VRIAIFGVGGAGGVFGAQLAAAGEDVVFIARGATLAALSERGLVVERPAGEIRIQRPVATDDPSTVAPVELVILAGKTWQVAEVARATRPLLAEETAVLPLQNGVEAAEEVARETGERHALVGLCGTISYAVEPGRIRNLGGPNFIRFSERGGEPGARAVSLPGALSRAERIRATLAGAGIEAEIPADIDRAVWEKFLFVVSSGGVGAVTRSPIGEVRAEPRTRELLERAMSEIWQVGRARGVALPDDAVARAMSFADRLPPDATTSLQRDLMEGRPSELEAWNGAVVRLGSAAGVATPVHDFIYRSLLLAERRHLGDLGWPTEPAQPRASR